MKHIELERDGDVLRAVIDRSGDALNRVKTALNDAFDIATALEIVTFRSRDHQEALAAVRERRAPRFEGR